MSAVIVRRPAATRSATRAAAAPAVWVCPEWTGAAITAEQVLDALQSLVCGAVPEDPHDVLTLLQAAGAARAAVNALPPASAIALLQRFQACFLSGFGMADGVHAVLQLIEVGARGACAAGEVAPEAPEAPEATALVTAMAQLLITIERNFFMVQGRRESFNRSAAPVLATLEGQWPALASEHRLRALWDAWLARGAGWSELVSRVRSKVRALLWPCSTSMCPAPCESVCQSGFCGAVRGGVVRCGAVRGGAGCWRDRRLAAAAPAAVRPLVTLTPLTRTRATRATRATTLLPTSWRMCNCTSACARPSRHGVSCCAPPPPSLFPPRSLLPQSRNATSIPFAQSQWPCKALGAP